MSNTANFSANRAKVAELKTQSGKQDTIIAHHLTAHAKHDTGHGHQVDIKAKLDTIATNTANIKVSTDSVNLNVDTLESLQTATKNALFTDPAGSGNTVGENASAINQNLITNNSKLDTINTTLTAGGVVDTSALATHAKQDTIKNEITALKNSLTGDGAGGDNAGGVILKAINDNLISTNTAQTSGTQIVKIMGSEDATIGGTQRQIHIDGNGNLQTNIVNTIFQVPANSANSHITDDPANSVAVGLKGRTTIGTATTETFLLCDSDGKQINKSNTNRSNGSEVSYLSGQSISGSGTFEGSAIAIDPNTRAVFVEFNFSHTGIKFELMGSLDGSNFFGTGIEFNAGGLAPATLTGLETILGTSGAVVAFPPHIKFKVSNSDSSAQTATLSYVIQTE